MYSKLPRQCSTFPVEQNRILDENSDEGKDMKLDSICASHVCCCENQE